MLMAQAYNPDILRRTPFKASLRKKMRPYLEKYLHKKGLVE
jgi:hypothetical protein